MPNDTLQSSGTPSRRSRTRRRTRPTGTSGIGTTGTRVGAATGIGGSSVGGKLNYASLTPDQQVIFDQAYNLGMDAGCKRFGHSWVGGSVSRQRT